MLRRNESLHYYIYKCRPFSAWIKIDQKQFDKTLLLCYIIYVLGWFADTIYICHVCRS